MLLKLTPAVNFNNILRHILLEALMTIVICLKKVKY